MIKKINNNTKLILLILVLITAVFVYRGSLNNGFVNWDDNQNVYQNQYIKSINLQNFKTYFTRPLIGMYTPLVYVSFAIDYSIGQLNPYYYHLTNLVLHLLNIILIWLIILALVNNPFIAFICCLLFAIHPVNTGGVAPVSVRGSLLYSVFYLSAFLTYLMYLLNRKVVLLLVSLVLFCLSLLSKSAAVVLPVLMLACDVYLKRKDYRKMMFEKLPFFVIALIFGYLTIYFRADAGHLWNSYQFSFIERLLLASHTLLFYIYKLFVPLNLSAYYPYPEMQSGHLPWNYYLAPLILLFLVFLFSVKSAIRRDLFFGIVFYLVHIGLVLKVIPMGDEIACDRYAYLPYIGIFFILGVLFNAIHNKVGKTGTVIGMVVILLWLSWLGNLSVQRIKVWKNSISLYNDITSKYPDVGIVYYNRGIAYLEQKKVDKALSDFSKAIELNPYLDDAWIYRGNIRAGQQQYREALLDLNKAVELNPHKALTYVNRGSLLYLMNYKPGACSDWNKASELGSSQATEMLNLYCR